MDVTAPNNNNSENVVASPTIENPVPSEESPKTTSTDDKNDGDGDDKSENNNNNKTKRQKKKRWFPLESNPTLMNRYIAKLGFDTSQYEFVDVYSTESWALEMIPQPVVAVIMLYPLTETQEAFRHAEREALVTKKQGEEEEGEEDDDDIHSHNNQILNKVWYITQRIGNACGTIGILHALANIPEGLRVMAIDPNSWLGRFYESCPTMLSPDVKADLLENNDVIDTLHDEATSDSSNQTSRGTLEDKVITHFVTLVHVDGELYELDGRKDGPVPHGKTDEMNLLRDACRVVEEFMKRDPGEMRFTILALAPKQEGG